MQLMGVFVKMKRFVCFFLILPLIFSAYMTSNAQEDVDSAVPFGLVQFSSIESSSLSFFVSAGGQANIQYSVFLKNNAGPVIVKTYIEKKSLGLFWSRVETGTKDDEWTDRFNKRYFVGSHTLQLSGSGTYRATIEIFVGSDILKKHTEFKYDVNGLKGDADANGRITAADARLVLRFAAKIQKYSQSQEKISDMNDDGRITSADARLILRISALL